MNYQEWDPTNFLVDLSGQYSLCKNVGKNGHITVDRPTQDNVRIGGLVDSVRGSGTYAEIVNKYVTEILSRWPGQNPYEAQVMI